MTKQASNETEPRLEATSGRASPVHCPSPSNSSSNVFTNFIKKWVLDIQYIISGGGGGGGGGESLVVGWTLFLSVIYIICMLEEDMCYNNPQHVLCLICIITIV